MRLIPKCAIMARAMNRLREGLQLKNPGSLTSLILQAKEATFLSVDGCSEKASEFYMPGYQLKPRDGKQPNWSIKEHRGMMEKLNLQ